jgi:GntR family transcriptional regulator / MocR family aminotransferase
MPPSWTSAGLDLQIETSRSRRRASLEESLRAAIQSRRLAAGTSLPSTRALARDLGLSRGTVTAAYDQLTAEGYLQAQQGAGTRVADLGPAPHPAPARRSAGTPRWDLRPGTPDVGAFPVAVWMRCLRQALNSAPAEVYGYGARHGTVQLRRELVGYLGRSRGVRADPDQVVITNGCTEALSLLGRVLADTGTTDVAMEDPGFVFHREVLRRSGQAVRPLAVDEEGARVDDLVGAPELQGVRAVVLTPAHQYPTGATLAARRRHAVAAWARQVDGLIIEDDYDGEFRYDGQPIGSIQGTAPEHVAYIGTASKALGPGLRLGWVVLPHRLVDAMLTAKGFASRGTEVVAQLALAELIAGHGYDRQVRRMRGRYRRRRDLLTAALAPLHRHRLPPTPGISAGLQLLVPLPADGPDEPEVVQLAAAEGLALEGLGQHWHAGAGPRRGLVIGFSRPAESSYVDAVAMLAAVLRRALA